VYVRTAESFVYLALVTDKYSRKIVGAITAGTRWKPWGASKRWKWRSKGSPPGHGRSIIRIVGANIVATRMSSAWRRGAWASA
jgi:hypothetical protein